MSTNQKTKKWRFATLGILVVVAGVAFMATRSRWLPLLHVIRVADESADASAPPDPHAGHDHRHGHHHELPSIELSKRGLQNIGFAPFAVELIDYARTLALPAIVVERPGKSQIHITAPLTGIVDRIFVAPGEAVDADTRLFAMRLTHEELVAAQRQFLETFAQRGIVERELKRLKDLGEGVVAGKRILEQQYELDRLEAALDASQQAMLLHGLTEAQIAEVRQSGRLFREITIQAPEHRHEEEACAAPHLFSVQHLGVAPGEHVEVGRDLAVLTDHCELHIEALAFEDDARAIRRAVEANRPAAAVQLDHSSLESDLRGLEILYVAGQIDPASRAFKVYVRLPNRIALDKESPGGKRFIEWAFKPGQRMELRIPVETWNDQIVLPTTAVVEEAAEAYVYRQDGDHFDQVQVHIRHRDQHAVVVANDGALFPGDVIAGEGAYQMHLAWKNQSGAAIDPHAGHNH